MPPFIPYDFEHYEPDEMRQRARNFEVEMNARRSVRHFSNRSVPRGLIESAIRTASSAPSGAHRQPWKFVAVSDPQLKKKIRFAVEEEEKTTYELRMSKEWKEAVRPMGTDWRKPYLEIAPWIVVVFEQAYSNDGEGDGPRKNYYVKESVGIACGIFISALHHMGLATLTHTPSPMGFLANLLQRPDNERGFMMFPVGYPSDDAKVPSLHRKSLAEVATFHT